MNVPVHHITEQGYTAAFKDDSWLRDAAQQAIKGELVSLSANFSITRAQQRVAIDLSYHVHSKMPCMRCAHAITLKLKRAQTLYYEPMSQEDREEELELQEEDLDIGWDDDGKIDLGVVLCEAITLDLPMVIHCACDFVVEKNPEGCLQENKIEERSLENLFVDLFKTQ